MLVWVVLAAKPQAPPKPFNGGNACAAVGGCATQGDEIVVLVSAAVPPKPAPLFLSGAGEARDPALARVCQRYRRSCPTVT
jgi:hypothetical protein